MPKKKIEEYTATGRRKTAVSAIRLRPGKGNIDIGYYWNMNSHPGLPTIMQVKMRRDLA